MVKGIRELCEPQHKLAMFVQFFGGKLDCVTVPSIAKPVIQPKPSVAQSTIQVLPAGTSGLETAFPAFTPALGFEDHEVERFVLAGQPDEILLIAEMQNMPVRHFLPIEESHNSAGQRQCLSIVTFPLRMTHARTLLRPFHYELQRAL